MTTPETPETADWPTFRDALNQTAATLKLKIPETRARKMFGHFLLMTETNRLFNLTRITEPAEAAVKHYADSLALLACPGVDPNYRCAVLDVGTGAGFPAVPLAVMCPAWKITAIDGTGKKIRFLQQAVRQLQLPNIDVHQTRAANWRKTRQGAFDRVLLRAVGKVGPALNEVHPLVRGGGEVVFYKTAAVTDDERDEGARMAKKNGLLALPDVDILLSASDEPLRRKIIRFEKIAKPRHKRQSQKRS